MWCIGGVQKNGNELYTYTVYKCTAFMVYCFYSVLFIIVLLVHLLTIT